MKHLAYKIRTQKGLILEKMMQSPHKWFTVGDFCGGSPSCPFIGYKAAQRICELMKEGLVVARWSSRKTALGGKVKEYSRAENCLISSIEGKLYISVFDDRVQEPLF